MSRTYHDVRKLLPTSVGVAVDHKGTVLAEPLCDNLISDVMCKVTADTLQQHGYSTRVIPSVESGYYYVLAQDMEGRI